jgi:YegS/Rv2252/BmrU family lipid kinase
MPTARIRACLITNPRSGRGGVNLSRVLPILRAHGWDVTVKQKLKGGMATDLARQAAKDGYDVVVACGGDGTLSEVVGGLVGTNTVVGAIPGGTVNEWTREVGISRRLDVAARQLVGAVRRRIDVGLVTVNDKKRRHFLLMAGLGIDGAVMARVSKPLKNRIGPLAVGLAAVRALPSFDPIALEIEIGETRWKGRAGQIVVGNTRGYGGFTRFTPHAFVDDGLLDLCIVTARNPANLAGQAASLLLRRHPDMHSAELYRAGRLTVNAPKAIPLQVDGGFVKEKGSTASGHVTYTFSVVAQSLTVLVPAAYDGDLFKKRPIAVSAGGDDSSTGAGNDRNGNKGKGKKRELSVVSVGPDTITAVRLKNGRVTTLLLSPDTITRDADGHKVETQAFLSRLREGDLIRVKGPADKQRGTIEAQRIKLLTPAATSPFPP